jgi:glycosyltransferase involved in cell wall biosynthesis
LKFSEKLGIKNSKYIVADNIGIKNYIKKTYKKDSELITYGGDQAFKVMPDNLDLKKYPFLNSNYAFSVARIQPDNNIDLLLKSFDSSSKIPFVLVGNWENSAYGIDTKKKYVNKPNLILLDAIYNQKELNLLRSNCEIYLHGHSAGGTNPALVEAMNLGLAVFAFDCEFNKFTTNFKASYFKNSKELIGLINTTSKDYIENNKKSMLSIAKEDYQWKTIASKYSKKFNK